MTSPHVAPADEASPEWREGLAPRLAALRADGPWRTRFAPAPTGHLHLGHVVNALFVWGIARAFGGHVTVRIEDHDRSRSRREFEQSILDDLAWLGFRADDGSDDALRRGRTTARQSDNDDAYGFALAALEGAGRVYPCRCSRRDIADRLAALGDAPTTGETLRYPGTCRTAGVDPTRTYARRVRLDEGTIRFDDLRLGPQTQDPAREVGDVLVRDRHRQWTYQFAVVVDDLAQGIDLIIRGEDLLDSTGRQRALATQLGAAQLPAVLHHPLVRHADGAKLSKAAGDTAIGSRRLTGESADQVLGEAAWHAGLQATPRPISAAEVPRLFTSRPS